MFDPRRLPDLPLPKELSKANLPPYVIEPPDVLAVEAVRVVPLPPYRLEPLDVLVIGAKAVFPDDPLNGPFPIDPDGVVNLGPAYGGPVRVAGLTTEEAQKVVQDKVRKYAKAAEVTVALAHPRCARQIAGRHTLRPDGTIGLGTYGSVAVAGLTIAEARRAIEAHLAEYLYRPEVSVDVVGFHSKWYYVITDLGGRGEHVVKVPHTGNETVLDAVASAGGLPAVSNKTVWVARPGPDEHGEDQILPVDWCGIARRGQVRTNYQVMPGDRVYVVSRPPSAAEACFARVLAPVRRALGAGP
jgi:polysaccharide export outer membrane protein